MSNTEIAQQVFELNQQHKEIEKKLSELKERLKAAGSGKYGNYLVAIEDRTRESFSLKDAREALSESMWERLKRFINVTEYQQVKVVKA
jgi:hypothetical protein